MGLLHDALSLGYITMDEYEEMREEWSVYGYQAGVMGNTDAFQLMAEDLEAKGITDLANEAWAQQAESAYFYAAENDFKIFYDPNMYRWRWEAGTPQAGQFTYDPYSEMRF
jgi:hypothetical protein